MSNKLINNYLLSVLNTVAGLILPIITFPYISRVLGAENLGIINFATSYGYYFMHLASFGISSYAIREISRIRNDKEKLYKVGNEIYNINVLFSILSGTLYMIGVFVVPKFRANILVFSMYSLSLYTNFLSLEWLFQAFDDYTFSTVRSIAVRILSIIAVFVFVKKRDDYSIYMLILTISEMGARASNLYYAKKRYIKFNLKKKFLNFKSHFKSLSTLFIFRMINGLSANLDKIMIGFILVYKDVGIYSAGIKFILLIIPLIENIGMVLFPKINISAGDSLEEYKYNVKLNYELILMVSIPMAMGLFLLSPMIIRLFAGNEFLDAINVSRIMSLIIILSPIGDLLGSKILLVFKKDNWLLICSLIVAVSNVVLNIIFIPLWGITGATVASVLSYCVSVLSRFFFSKKLIDFKFITLKLFKYLAFTLPYVCIYVFFNSFINSNILWMILYMLVAVIIYCLELFISKDEYFVLVLKKFLKKG